MIRSLRNYVLLVVFVLPGAATGAQIVPVANIEELYAAVNNPAYAGATIDLAPGIYPLSALDATGIPRQNDGRLELQLDMSLKGVEGDRSAVIISAVNLPASSFPQSNGPNAAVRMGRGRNALEWVTVRDARLGQANIDTGLQSLDPDPAYVRIAHVASTGSTRGLNILNFGRQTSGQIIEADVEDSHFFDNTFNLAEGMRIGNFQGSVGSRINVRMSGNRFWGQKQGRLVVNNRSSDSTIRVFSSGNRFYDNGGGTIIAGALSSNNTRADGNTIDFEAYGDHFIGNTRDSDFDHGGLILLGSENVSTLAGGGSNNVVRVKLWGCRMVGNDTADLIAIGARSAVVETASLSRSNQVTIELHGDGAATGRWQPIEYTRDSLPEGTYGNTVTVIRY